MVFRFDPYALDLDRLELRKNEQVVAVEPQVFSLLAYLIENRDRVVGKDELIEKVWAGRVVSDATINSRINAARRAVADTGRAQAIIRTFPRRGFRFVASVTNDDGSSQQIGSCDGAPSSGSAVHSAADANKPGVMVLPFQQIGDDDEGFSFALAERFRAGLARRTGLHAIGLELADRRPTQLADFTALREGYGADYALTGAVHRKGARLRVFVELCETQRGAQVWSEHYDRDAGDFLTLEDDLAHLVLMALRWNIAAYDGKRVAASQSPASNAERLSKAALCFYTPTPESYRQACDLLDTVLADEPGNAMALGMRSFGLFAGSSFQVALLSSREREAAISMADRALELEERSDFLHWIRGTLSLNFERQHDTAMAHADRALEINPHFSQALRLRGEALGFAGQIDRAIGYLEDLLKADPRAPANAIVQWDLALLRFGAGEDRDALASIDQALVQTRTLPDFYLTRAAILTQVGRSNEAHDIVKGLFSRFGWVSTASIRHPPFREDEKLQRYLRGLRAAGVP